jgi:hypothetical protein
MTKRFFPLLPVLMTALPILACADSWKDESAHGRHGHREFKEEFREGNCKVEREGKKDGEYKEKRECKGQKQGRREFKEEYADGNCKVEREMKKDGEYKEKRECKRPHYGYYAPSPVYVPMPSRGIVEPGITIHGRVSVP